MDDYVLVHVCVGVCRFVCVCSVVYVCSICGSVVATTGLAVPTEVLMFKCGVALVEQRGYMGHLEEYLGCFKYH